MKNSIVLLAITALSTTAILSSCSSSSDKVQDEQEKVLEAKEELAEAEKEYQAEIKSYREENNKKIAANEKSIAEFKERIRKDKLEAKEDYYERIAELEQQNSDMKVKLDEFETTSKDKWETFKMEYNRDMENLGLALGDFYKTITD